MSKSKREQTNLEYSEHSFNLFEALNLKRINTKTLSISWLQNFQENPSKSIASIIALLLQSCDFRLESSQISENFENFQTFKKMILQKSKEIDSSSINPKKNNPIFPKSERFFLSNHQRKCRDIEKSNNLDSGFNKLQHF